MKLVWPFECFEIYGIDDDKSDKIIMADYNYFHNNFVKSLGRFSVSLVLQVKRQLLAWVAKAL